MRKNVRIIGQLLLFFAILFATEQAIPWLYEQIPTDLREWDRVEKRKLVVREPESFDVLFLGDSTGVQGIVPDEFTKLTGRSTYNLATYADRNADGDIYLLNEYLDRHPAPESVIVIRSVLSWYLGYGYGTTRLQFNRIDHAEMLLSKGIMKPLEFAQIALEKVFPSLMYRDKMAFLRRAMTDPLGYDENLAKSTAGDATKGYEAFDPQMHRTNLEINEKTMDAFWRMRTKEDTLNLAPYSLPLLQELCRVATEHGTRLFVAFNANAPFIRDDKKIGGSILELHALIKQTLKDTPNCTVFPDIWVLPNEYLSDLTHTNNEGASVYTGLVSEAFLKAQGKKAQTQ